MRYITALSVLSMFLPIEQFPILKGSSIMPQGGRKWCVLWQITMNFLGMGTALEKVRGNQDVQRCLHDDFSPDIKTDRHFWERKLAWLVSTENSHHKESSHEPGSFYFLSFF